jgi:cobalt-zinc-cadmium efflux system outer membrane protein
MRILLVLVLPFFVTACATRSVFDKQYVSDKIKDKSGFDLADLYSDSLMIPPPVVLEDGLTEDESVSLALWNSPQLKVDLAALGFARADLIDAKMLPNPVFSLLFPVGPKQLEFTLSYYADILWQRPRKVAIAKLNTENVAENLVQHGLSMIRDVCITYADLFRAGEELKLYEEKVKLDGEIAKIASLRVEAGDISELEETAFRLAESQARESFLVAKNSLETQKIRFLTMLGLASDRTDIKIDPASLEEVTMPDQEQLIEAALAFRPDMRASEIEIEIAGEKLGWERSKILNLTVMLDANAKGTEGFEMGPGVQLAVPIFNFNKGGRVRAQTEMQRAAANYILVQQSIRSQVVQSYQDYLAAKAAYDMLKNEILPVSEKSVINGESAYLTGEISYLEFLEFKRQDINAQLRFFNAEANVRKSLAGLYFSIGGKLSLPDMMSSN